VNDYATKLEADSVLLSCGPDGKLHGRGAQSRDNTYYKRSKHDEWQWPIVTVSSDPASLISGIVTGAPILKRPWLVGSMARLAEILAMAIDSGSGKNLVAIIEKTGTARRP
jgi:hypothetical protein